MLHTVALLPVAMMVCVDPRRRPLSATVTYAVVLFGVLAWLLSHRPALAPMPPGPIETAVAFLLTLVSAMLGGTLGRWLADSLEPSTESPQ